MQSLDVRRWLLPQRLTSTSRVTHAMAADVVTHLFDVPDLVTRLVASEKKAV
jgi:hypothetical protein